MSDARDATDATAAVALPSSDAAAAAAPALPQAVSAAHRRTIEWERRILVATTARSAGSGEADAGGSSPADAAAASDASVAAASSSAAIASAADAAGADVAFSSSPAVALSGPDPLLSASDSSASITALAARASEIAVAAPVVSAAQRISQLDALALDAELGWMLHTALRRLTRFLPSSSWLAPGAGDHKAESELLLNATVFLATIARDRATPGMKLQNVVFQNWGAVARAQRTAGAGAASEGWVAQMARKLFEGVVRSRWLSAGSGGGGRKLPTAAAALTDSALGSLDIPRSNFAPFDPAAATSAVSSLLDDAASASAAAPPLLSACSAGSAAVVLSSSLPSTAAVPLSSRQKCLYFLGSVVLRYAWSKLHAHMTVEGWGGFPAGSWQLRVYRWTRRIEVGFQAASIGNFILFLRSGEYRSVLERLLLIRLVYLRPRLSRAVSFEFMNQQIAWGALSDFMLFLLPLIPFASIIHGATKVGEWISGSGGSAAGGRSGAAGGGVGGAESVSASLAAGCPCCGLSPPFQPYVAAPCRHIFCYYCLAGHRMAGQQQARGIVAAAHAGATSDFKCPRCDQSVISQAPLAIAAEPAHARASIGLPAVI